MASQPVGGALNCLEIASYARGYHAYCNAWIPVIGQVLRLKREPDNCKDKYAIAIVLEECIVGHVSYNLAKCVSQFLSRDANKGFARVYNRQQNQ